MSASGLSEGCEVRTRWDACTPLIVAVGAALLTWLGVKVGPWFLVIPIGVTLWHVGLWWFNQDVAMRATNAAPADPRRDGALIATVTELAHRAGIDPPRVYVCEVGFGNAFATTTRSGSVVAVTRPLYERLNSRELRAVMGHEIGHLKNRDVAWSIGTQSMAAMFMVLAVIVGGIIATAGAAVDDDDRRRGDSNVVFVFMGLLVFVASVILTRIITALSSRRRESLADQTAADLCDPRDLASALLSMEQLDSGQPELTAGLVLVAPRMLTDPYRGSWWDQLLATHPSTATRVARLMERARRDGLGPEAATAPTTAPVPGPPGRPPVVPQTAPTVEEWRSSRVPEWDPRTPRPDEVLRFGFKPGELVYAYTPGRRLKVRTLAGIEQIQVMEHGQAALTTRGLVFLGRKRVRMSYRRIKSQHWLASSDGRRLIVALDNREHPVGIQFDDARMPVELLLARVQHDFFRTQAGG